MTPSGLSRCNKGGAASRPSVGLRSSGFFMLVPAANLRVRAHTGSARSRGRLAPRTAGAGRKSGEAKRDVILSAGRTTHARGVGRARHPLLEFAAAGFASVLVNRHL